MFKYCSKEWYTSEHHWPFMGLPCVGLLSLLLQCTHQTAKKSLQMLSVQQVLHTCQQQLTGWWFPADVQSRQSSHEEGEGQIVQQCWQCKGWFQKCQAVELVWCICGKGRVVIVVLGKCCSKARRACNTQQVYHLYCLLYFVT